MKWQSGPFKIHIAVNGLHSRLTSVGCCAFPLAELEHRSLWGFFAGVLLVTTYSNLPKILKFHTFCPKIGNFFTQLMAKEDGLGPEVSVLLCNTNLEVQRNIFCGLVLFYLGQNF